MISAEVICDSVSERGHRLTTFKLRYPKFIHGEFMTHRVISRNASSSRAIPTAKLIEEVSSDALRAAPVFWGKNQSGMQAAEELSDDRRINYVEQFNSPREQAKRCWRLAALAAVEWAEHMSAVGAHKQIVNRLLEPFSHINVVATATEWDNFFGLRLDKGAQPEMRALAVAMWQARSRSAPGTLKPGDWHLPFVLSEEHQDAAEGDYPPERLIKVSVARCARVSYESFETGKHSTVEEDLKLYDRLVGAQPLHASPAEHQATPDEWMSQFRILKQERKTPHGTESSIWQNRHEWGNLVGWRQYRKMLQNEAVAPLPEEFR